MMYSIGGFHFTKRILSVSAVRILIYDRVAFMCVADNLQGASCSLPISVRAIQPCSAIQLRSRVAPSIYELACIVIHSARIRVSRHCSFRFLCARPLCYICNLRTWSVSLRRSPCALKRKHHTDVCMHLSFVLICVVVSSRIGGTGGCGGAFSHKDSSTKLIERG